MPNFRHSIQSWSDCLPVRIWTLEQSLFQWEYTMPLMIHVWRIVTENCVWQKILKSCAWRLISKRCVWQASDGRLAQCFEKLRLAGVWRASGAMYWNQTSGAMFQNQASGATFQNLLPDTIFCDYASDVYHEWHIVPNNIQSLGIYGPWEIYVMCLLCLFKMNIE